MVVGLTLPDVAFQPTQQAHMRGNTGGWKRAGGSRQANRAEMDSIVHGWATTSRFWGLIAMCSGWLVSVCVPVCLILLCFLCLSCPF